MPLKAVRRDDVECFMHDEVAAGKTATREKTKQWGLSINAAVVVSPDAQLALLGAIFSYAVRQGIRIDNPAHGVVKFAGDSNVCPMMSTKCSACRCRWRQELIWKPAIAATWLMILTGWRRGEVLGLR